MRVLEAGKHCFVEKPLAQSVPDAERVAAAEAPARADGRPPARVPPGRRKLKEIADSGELGEIRYIYSNRLNLGELRARRERALEPRRARRVGVLRLAGGEEPSEVEARGECYMRPGIEDVVFGFLRFPSGLAAHLHLSWLDPHKERRFTVVGSKRMATFDDMEIERKLTVYDKGFDQDFTSYGEYIQRSGDIWSPRISNEEPLRDRVPALHRLRALGGAAALGRRQRAARGARAGRAAAVARGELACCSRLSGRRGCCSART